MCACWCFRTWTRAGRRLVPHRRAAIHDVLAHDAVTTRFSEALASFAVTHAGSSTRIERAMLLAEPPSIDGGELTDKRSLNQKAVLAASSGARGTAVFGPGATRARSTTSPTDIGPTMTLPLLNVDALTAIDVHVHLEAPADDSAADRAARKYFGDSGAARDPQGLAEYYRSRRMAFVIFSVDERLSGRPQLSNDAVASFAAANADVAIAFASIDPNRGADGVREARELVSSGRVRGLKLHPPLQQFEPNDRLAYPLYEVFAEARLPVLFHTGHSGIGTGMPGGGGIRLKYGNPMPIDDVAVDFPEMPIILAHPSFPWQDEAISICLHKPTVYIDLSGWSPKYFSPTLVQYANTLLKHKVLFGSDYPLLTPDRWLADLEKTGIREEVRPLILKENAMRLFGLGHGDATS